MSNAISSKFSGMQKDLLSLNDLLRQNGCTVQSSSFLEKAQNFFFPSYAKAQIQAVADKILTDLKNPVIKDDTLKLADAFIRCFERSWQGEQITQIFDRTIAPYRHEYGFMHKENISRFDKWQRYGQDPLIYQRHPEFCTFMENSGLLSQMKITRDTFKEIDGEAAIVVEGEWMKWADFKVRFKVIYSERYREAFIIGIDNQVYTYLDNGKGLQPHHPYLTETTPASTLSNTDYEKVLERARLFVRDGEEQLSTSEHEELNRKRTYVLQLVTSFANRGSTKFHDLIINPKHPYLRLIVGEDKPGMNLSKGEVYEVGFGRKSPMAIPPLISSEGRFRSPDINEYLSFDEKVVTNIAVTSEEARAFANYVTDYHRSEVNIGNPIGFHYLNQNCSTFVWAALESANIKVPAKITLAELLPKITPSWILETGKGIRSLASRAFVVIKDPIEFLPNCLKNPLKRTAKKISDKFKNMLEFLTAVVFIPLKLALGDAFGSGGRAFVKIGEKSRKLEPGLKRLKTWFELSKYIVNLPGVLQKWQRQQPSTVVYKNPIRLCIVP